MKAKFRKAALAAAVAGTFTGASTGAQAAGFALIEQNASGLGNAYAGAAAIAEDASTIFFNPAGLTRFDSPQVVLAGHAVRIDMKFSDRGSTSPTAIGTLGGNGGNAGDTVFIPNAYFSMPVSDRLAVGVGLNAPFGLATEYDADWVGRFQGIKSDLMTVNINPTIAYKVTDAVSIGAGVNFQKFDAELTNKISGAAINIVFAGQEFDAKLKADDTAWGWNVGALIDVGPATRVGVSYRSTMEYTLEGSVTVRDPGGAVFAPASGPAKADVTLPDIFSASLVHSINDRLDLLADVTYTRWSEIKQVRILNPGGGEIDTLVLNFDDSYRYSVGLNYKVNDRFVAKFGVAYDESPVSDVDRTVRLPDNDRKWVALGGSYRVSNAGRLDFGYAHLFVSDTRIDQDRGIEAAYGRVLGTYKASIDILSVQYTHSF